jgi:hypothetical protein
MANRVKRAHGESVHNNGVDPELFASTFGREHTRSTEGRTNLKAGYSMKNLSPRHVKTEESLRLGVVSGWYSTKVSGTFVSGPHDSEAECLRKIAEIDLAPVKAAKAKPVE